MRSFDSELGAVNMCDEHDQHCHSALLYHDAPALLAGLHRFVTEGLKRQAAVIVIATEAHLTMLRERLSPDGNADYNLEALCQSGQLICLDAHDLLPRLMNNGSPDRAAFDAIIGGLIASTKSRYNEICAYGELVNLLWQQNNRAAAHQLERWWNELIAQYRFSLLCGYRASVFDCDPEAHQGIDEICQTHSHFDPGLDVTRFEMAVNDSLRQVLPDADIHALRQVLRDRCVHVTHMPEAQATIFGLQKTLPSLAHDVRMLARDNYHRCAS